MTNIGLENKNKKPFFKSRKKLWVIISIFLAVIMLGTGLLYVFGRGIFTKNWSDSSPFFKMLSGDDFQLKGEGDGRINILLLGYGDGDHDGQFLTDTIQVLSIDPEDKSMAMLSIPRDLYVEVKKPWFKGKINTLYKTKNDGEFANKIDECNPELVKKTVGEILDLPIHYYVSVNFSGFKEAIDAVGGVDIDVERTFTDYQYPSDDGVHYLPPQTFKAGIRHMNGDTALIYSRSRHGNNSEGSDFARSKRQQKVMQAFKEKLLVKGMFNSPSALISLVNIIGSNIKTDFTVSEIKALASLIKNIDSTNFVTKTLENGADGVVETSNINGISYVKPKAGINEWIEIRKIAHEIFTDPFLRKEKANIEIINSSNINGAAADLSSTLKSYGYNITKVSNGEDSLEETVIYDYSGGDKKYTLEFLSKRLSADIIKKSRPENSQADIQIILGENHKTVYAKNKY